MSTQPIHVDFHQGRALMEAAGAYPDLPRVIGEGVQNGIDSGATRIEIRINASKRTANICDNGSGASSEKITEALHSIYSTLKKKGRYGQFGRGFVSPCSVCREFTFTTCPAPRRNGYTRYPFIVNEIKDRQKVVINPEDVPNLEFEPAGKTWWRSMVDMRGITKDRRTSRIDIDQLASDIALKYGKAIRENNIDITIISIDEAGSPSSVTVTAPEFSGQKIDPFKPNVNKECGEVEFNLWVSPLTKGGRKGAITFGTLDNPSCIDVKQFITCTSELLAGEVAKALASGVFQGEIRAEKIKLHNDRTRFEDNDALFAFCEVIELWYNKVGKSRMVEAEEQASEDRFQRLGTQVMPFAEAFFAQPQFEILAKQITLGTIGKKHANVPKGSIVGPDSGPSLAVDGQPFEGKGRGESGGGGGGVPKKDHPQHTPGTVYGPRGRTRTEVRGSSTGLRFEYVEMEDPRIPFAYDRSTGALTFNIRNANWGLCQENDVYLHKYQIAVVMKAIQLELHRSIEGELNPELVEFTYDGLLNESFAIRNTESYTPGSKSKR